MQASHRLDQLANIVNDYQIDIDWKGCVGFYINKPMPRSIKPHIMNKKDQEKLYRSGINLLNHYRGS